MPDLPADWTALCALVFMLGMRHGFDADHLATIDGLTRLGLRHGAPFARSCGVLFSLGHGAVVVLVVAAVGLAGERWAPPGWLDVFGAWVAIVLLLLIGMANLRSVLAAAPGTPVTLAAPRWRWLGGLLRPRSASAVAGVGALFALSFDTVSLAALLAVAAAAFGGVERAVGLGLVFVVGLLASGGLNGWWIARLITRSDRFAATASRVMALAVAGISLLVAGWGLARLASPTLAQWNEGRELAFGGVVVAVVAASYVIAATLARREVAGRP